MTFMAALAAGAAGAVGSSVVGSLLGGGGSTGGELIGKDELLAAIQQYQNTNLAQSNALYGKQAAMTDAQGAIRSIFDEYSKTSLPTIYQAELGSGGYNSTTGQLMANDAFASANTKAASVLLDTIMKYRGIEQKDYEVMASLVKGTPPAVTNPTADKWGNLAGDALGAGVSRWLKKPVVDTSGFLPNYTGSPV